MAFKKKKPRGLDERRADAEQARDMPATTAGPTAQRAVSEPSVRVQSNWTPQRVRTVAQSADNGSMQPLADLCDQMIRDDRFGDALQSLADGVLASELKWEKGLRSKRKTPEEKIPLEEEADNDWWETYSEAEYSLIMVWREMLGYCWARLTWEVSPVSGRWVPRVTFWHPRHFHYDNFRRQWVVKVDDSGTELDIQAGDGWVVFYRRSTTRPWADGQWRGLSRWWVLKSFAISDWGVHSEKAARQIITSDEGVSAVDRKQLAADLYGLSKDGVISLPFGFNYELVEASANTRDIYQAQIDAANMAGTIAILGQNLTTEISDDGSRAAGEVHERKENRKIRYNAESLSTTLRAQVMKPWAMYNFGAAAEPPWHQWQVSAPDDTEAKAAALSTLATAISTLASVGKAVPDEKLRAEFGVELVDIEIPTPPAPPVPPGGGGAGGAKPGAPKPKPKPTLEGDEPELASGIPVALSRGFISGQLYTDDVADSTRDKSSTELGAFVDRLLEVIGSADDYESIRDAVYAAYKDEAPPERLAELVEHAIIMAQLGGRLAVHQDASDPQLALALSEN